MTKTLERPANWKPRPRYRTLSIWIRLALYGREDSRVQLMVRHNERLDLAAAMEQAQ